VLHGCKASAGEGWPSTALNWNGIAVRKPELITCATPDDQNGLLGPLRDGLDVAMRSVFLPLAAFAAFAVNACMEAPKHPLGLQHNNPGQPDRPAFALRPACNTHSIEDAIRAGKKNWVATYIASGGDPDATIATDIAHGDIRHSLLSLALMSNQFAVALLLLDNGANPNGAPGENEFPLWWAARSGDIRITKELVARGAALDTQREGNGTTALHAAIYFDHPRIVRYLVDRGADTSKRTLNYNCWGVHGATALELAQKLGCAKCALAITGE
jgi:hypothetical protein